MILLEKCTSCLNIHVRGRRLRRVSNASSGSLSQLRRRASLAPSRTTTCSSLIGAENTCCARISDKCSSTCPMMCAFITRHRLFRCRRKRDNTNICANSVPVNLPDSWYVQGQSERPHLLALAGFSVAFGARVSGVIALP